MRLYKTLKFLYIRCRAKCHFAHDEAIASFYNFEFPIRTRRGRFETCSYNNNNVPSSRHKLRLQGFLNYGMYLLFSQCPVIDAYVVDNALIIPLRVQRASDIHDRITGHGRHDVVGWVHCRTYQLPINIEHLLPGLLVVNACHVAPTTRGTVYLSAGNLLRPLAFAKIISSMS